MILAPDVMKIVENQQVNGGPSLRPNRIANSADYETAISEAGFGKYNYFVFIVSLAVSIGPVIATSTMSFVIPVATCDLRLTPVEKGVLNVSTFVGKSFFSSPPRLTVQNTQVLALIGKGMTVAGFFWGYLSDKIGRKRLMTIGLLVDTAVVAAGSLSATFLQLAMFKFIEGLIICGPFSIFMTYISEVFPDRQRKLIILSTGLSVSVGVVLQSVIAWLLIPGQSQYNLFGLIPLKSWRLFMLVCSIPAFLGGIGSFFFIESPKFLLEKGRKQEALDALKRIYSINTGLPPSSFPVHYVTGSKIIDNLDGKDSFKSKLLAVLKDASTIFRPPYGPRILQFCFYQVSSMLGMNIIRLWLPQLLADRDSNTNGPSGQTLCESISKPFSNFDFDEYCANLVINSSLFVNMIILYSCFLVGQTIFISTVSRFGKKHFATLTLTIGAAAFVILPNVPAEYILIPSLIAASSIHVTHFCLLGIIVEVFPTSVRATSLSTITGVGRLGTVLTNIFVSSLLYTHCVYVFYGVCVLVGASAIGSFFMPTKPIGDGEEALSKLEENNVEKF